MKSSFINALIQVVIGGAIGWGSAWFVDEVLHLPWWLGFVVMAGIFGAIQHFSNQAEGQQQEQIAAAFAEQERKLRIAKKKLARLRKDQP